MFFQEQAANQPQNQPQAQPENANRLEELKKKYQKPAEPAKKEEDKPASGGNKLEELKKKYQNNTNLLNVSNRVSEPVYRTSMGKSVSTTHVACESKTVRLFYYILYRSFALNSSSFLLKYIRKRQIRRKKRHRRTLRKIF